MKAWGEYVVRREKIEHKVFYARSDNSLSLSGMNGPLYATAGQYVAWTGQVSKEHEFWSPDTHSLINDSPCTEASILNNRAQTLARFDLRARPKY